MTTRAREVPDRVQWHEGMLLAPQHFQQLTARGEGLLQYHLGGVTPFYWGVRTLDFDPVALLNGTLRVLDMEAVLPDGLVVTQTASDPELAVSLKEAFAATPTATLVIHLVVPAERAGGPRGAGALPRYTSYEGGPVVDVNTGDGELVIPRLRPRPSLFIGDTAPDKFVSIPVAHVAYRDESFALTDYIAPQIAVTPQSELGRLCMNIVRRVREKAMFLADRARASASTAPGPLVAATQRLAHNLSAGLPPVEVMLRTGVSHPYTLFLAMAGLVGQAAGAGPGVVPPVLDSYAHTALRASFGQIVDFLGEVLDGIHEDYRLVPFHDTNGVFELAMEPNWTRAGTLIIGVLAPPGAAEADTADWLNASLIASRTRMAALRERRVRGPARTVVAAPESLGIAPRRGEVLFTVEVNPQYIEAAEVLQIAHPSVGEGGRPREVVLYAPDRV